MSSPPDQGETGDRRHKYTVGWVCALPKEQAAAMAMLDERHPDLPKPANDSNTYTLGSIGNHNVVVACLPMGKIGTNSAANVANQMIRTFPAIRIGLMVGIGGGIPPKVRLGDVVVSRPVYDQPGVVQWDFGVRGDGGRLRRIGALNNPPTLLLTTLSKVEAQHYLTQPRMQYYLEERRQKYPNSSPTYLRTTAMRDVLFKPGYSHVHNPPVRSWLHAILSCIKTIFVWSLWLFGRELFRQGTSSSLIHSSDIRKKQEEGETTDDACQYCDKSQVISRRPREMRVHYGLIASGNEVIKDAAFRDALNEQFDGNLLCAEMEAAGLMDNFPCVVIRGICDYADSHKNYAWQEHAAAIAAAYAKELLEYVQPSEVALEQPVEEIMRHVAGIQRDIKELHALEDKNESRRILDWLSPIDYGSQQSNILKKWHPKTNQWFLGSDAFKEWLQSRGKSLYCPGIPGAGKTVLTSAVIKYLDEGFSTREDVGIAYIYCSFSRKETIENYLTSLLKQLVKKHPSPSLNIARGLVFIMIDALDECTKDNECRIELLREVSDLQAKHGVNLFATSRTIEEIAVHFESALTIPIHGTEDDIKIYMNKRLQVQDDELFDIDIREITISKVVEATGGMFLLAELYLNVIIVLPTRGDIKLALDNLAKGQAGLDIAYRLTMERIQNQGKEYYELAKQILAWIIYAIRPLDIWEIQHALATRPGMEAFDDDFVPSVKKILSVCAGIVTDDESNNTIRLFHYTAQEYLKHTESEWCPDAHSKLAIVCMTYVPFRDPYTSSDTYPLYDYAILNWGNHARISSRLKLEDVLAFLEENAIPRAEDLRMAWLEHIHGSWDVTIFEEGTTGLHLAAYFGLEETVLYLLDKYGLYFRDAAGQTPLHYAAYGGNEIVFKLLISRGSDINVQDNRFKTPLRSAIRSRHAHLVKWLLANEQIDPSLSGDMALSSTALYRKRADPNIRDEYGQTALFEAVDEGDTNIVNMLLTLEEIDPNTRDKDGQTVLITAASLGRNDIAEALLTLDGTNPNIQDRRGRTALLIAVGWWHSVAKTILTDERANPNIRDENGQTALFAAVLSESTNMVEMLLTDERTNPNIRDKNGQTALFTAAQFGYDDIVKVLLTSKEIDPNIQDTNGQTALFAAMFEDDQEALSILAYNNRLAIVEMLLDFEGIDPNIQDEHGQTALCTAAYYNDANFVNMLLAFKGIDPNIRDEHGQTALSNAVHYYEVDTVKMLLDFEGINPNIQDEHGQTALFHAVYYNNVDAVELLLDFEGIDPNIQDFNGYTALSNAVYFENVDIVKMLLAFEGIDPDIKDVNGYTPLAWATYNENQAIIDMLLATGKVDTNIPT
ncbi:ankyrin repeat protein [Hypoxylon cercidicola]|nr:ankyrin repeat protein [Hypoxylon cercidicola]